MEQRIIELETRFSHQEVLIEQLSDIVREQQDQIDALTKLVQTLMSQVDKGIEEVSNEPPPHY